MKTVFTLTAVLMCIAMQLGAQTVYVATTGSDTSDGSFEHPFATIPKAISVTTVPGESIYVRGGTYFPTGTINISRSGTSTNRYYLLSYPGERPLLNFSTEPYGSRGIRVSGSYWHIKGFDITRAGDNGMNMSGSNNIIEFCSFSENYDTGLQLGGGASNNQIINCDSYFNRDTTQGNADGFAPKLDVGSGNYFYGCRSWQNSDDGWDGYLRPSNNIRTTLENCWCFMNGYLKTGLPSSGNGNGYKLGGGDNTNADSLRHDMTLKNCLSFDNRVKGYDQNNNRGSMVLLNCTAYHNGTNYSISGPIASAESVVVRNCVALGSYGSLGSYVIQGTNSWMPPFVVTNADFVSVDTTGVRGPRNPDGSLPDVAFMHLADGSDLIDSGTNVGLPFYGNAPDLGCFESNYPNSVVVETGKPRQFRLEQNYPNPFNPSTHIRFSVETTQRTTLDVFNVLGQMVATLFDGVAEAGLRYDVQFDGRDLPSGVYYYRLASGTRTESKKLLLLK